MKKIRILASNYIFYKYNLSNLCASTADTWQLTILQKLKCYLKEKKSLA